VVCEVKAFTAARAFDSTIGSSSRAEVLKPIRNDIKKAAAQLRPLAGRG